MANNKCLRFLSLFYPVLLFLLGLQTVCALIAPLYDSSASIFSRWAIVFAILAEVFSTLFTFVAMGACLYAASRRGFLSGLSTLGVAVLLLLLSNIGIYLWQTDVMDAGVLILTGLFNGAIQSVVLAAAFFLLYLIFLTAEDVPLIKCSFSCRIFCACLVFALGNLIYELVAETLNVIDAVRSNLGIIYAADVFDMILAYLQAILYIAIGAVAMYFTVWLLERRAQRTAA